MEQKMHYLIDRLAEKKQLSEDDWIFLIKTEYDTSYLVEKSTQIRKKHYGTDVYIRGLIEISNCCKNNCKYCGIRKDNSRLSRYRLDDDTILECVAKGYKKGFRTFVLQGGEDPAFDTKRVENLIRRIKHYSDCAVTLSLGERPYEDYLRWFDTGADRYLLRHETADASHYSMLHPEDMSFENRIKCLYDLKKIGYQTGCGFMVGSPYQTSECLAKDLKFIADFQPHMIGIGPFISHKDTPFSGFKNGTLEMSLKLLSLARLACHEALIPSTTALGTIAGNGLELGIKAGANVVMPNLTPNCVKDKYSLYDNKERSCDIFDDLEELKHKVSNIGYNVVASRGDCCVSSHVAGTN